MLMAQFPVAAITEAALKNESNPEPFFFFHKCLDPDLKGCWVALGRFGPDLEKQFDIAGEVMFLFTPYEDLQRRTFNALVGRLMEEVNTRQIEHFGHVRFSPDPSVAMLWAPDPEALTRLESWNLQSRGAVVALIPGATLDVDTHRIGLNRSLRRVLASRDLYRGRNPVTGSDFFGRQDLLQILKAYLISGQSIGLFGLRRSGKTSVLREFARRNQRNFSVVQLDLESLSGLDEVPAALARSVVDALRAARENDPSIWLGSETEQRISDYMALSDRLVRVAQRNQATHFVVAVDELETLVPHLQGSPNQVRQLFGSLRGAAQKAENLSLLLTGVTTRFFEQSMLSGDVENPLFGFVEEVYLRPFNSRESHNLVGKLGRQMGLTWTDDALDHLHQVVGGFPFFVRDLASAVRTEVVEAIDQDATEIPVTRVDVEVSLIKWAEGAAKLWAEIVRTLGHHNEIMGEIASSDSDADIQDWARSGEDGAAAARSLEGLGLLIRADGDYRRADALQALQGLSSGPRLRPDELRRRHQERDDHSTRLRRLADSPEGVSLEFKSSLRWDYRQGVINKDLTRPILKTVAAFLNTQGGTLLIGINDKGQPLGIEKDLASLSNSEDAFERHVTQALCNAFGQTVVSGLVELSFGTLDGLRICAIDVKPSRDAVWFEDAKQDCFYVRMGNQSLVIRPREVDNWMATRSPQGLTDVLPPG